MASVGGNKKFFGKNSIKTHTQLLFDGLKNTKNLNGLENN